MVITVRGTDEPQQVLSVAGDFLASEPVLHNVILTLLSSRLVHPVPGRYWIVDLDGEVAGVVFRSPLHFIATVTPMPTEVVHAAVDRMAEEGMRLPGVSGEAATAARFAGHWSERTKVGATPTQGQRIYEVETVVPARPTAGTLRAATRDDDRLLVGWVEAFEREIGEFQGDATEAVARRIDAGELWIWADPAPVAMVGVFGAVSGVARLGPVYTPPECRARGYASALVADTSQAVLARGQRCMLYTDLENPTSNAIYRALGYRAVAEALKYRFDDDA
jgi:uncharacterized protein